MGNWEKQGSAWQYRESGVLSTGWILIDGKWYYLKNMEKVIPKEIFSISANFISALLILRL